MSNFKRYLVLQALCLSLLVLGAQLAFAGTISLTKNGDSAFDVVANGLGSPAGLDLTVTFDSSRLSNARVTTATGAILAANPGIGKVRFALLSTTALPGSGTIATITFDRTGDSLGDLGISGTVITAKGATIATSYTGFSETASGGTTGDTNSTVSNNPTGPGSLTTTTKGTGSGGGAAVLGGSVNTGSEEGGASTAKKDTPAQAAPQDAREAQAPVPAAADAAPAAEAPAVAKKVEKFKVHPVTSVIEKFRVYSAEKTPQKLAALFAEDDAAPFSQDPAIAIADGKATVTVTISHVPGEKAPNFSFNHARYVSLQQAGDGEWLLEVRPDKNAVRANITMTVEGVQQEIPLTVAPRAKVDLDNSGAVTEADFLIYLKGRGTDKAPDLNGDGKRDYVDDYIFTANYLLQKQSKPAAPQK